MLKMFSFDWKFGLGCIQLFSECFLLCNGTDDIFGAFGSLKISDSAKTNQYNVYRNAFNRNHSFIQFFCFRLNWSLGNFANNTFLCKLSLCGKGLCDNARAEEGQKGSMIQMISIKFSYSFLI
jgi:hypothetical protein